MSPHKVQKKAHSGRPRIPELWDREWLRCEFLEKHRNYHEIARQLGCSPNTVRVALRRHNLVRSKTPRFVVPPALAKALKLEAA